MNKQGVEVCKSVYPNCVRVDVYNLGHGRYLRIGSEGCNLRDMGLVGSVVIGVDTI